MFKAVTVAFLATASLTLILAIITSSKSETQKIIDCYQKKTSEIDTVIVGHCESQQGVNPFFFDFNAFNLGQEQQHFGLSSKFFETIFDDRPSVKRILIGVNPIELSAWHKPSGKYLREQLFSLGIFPDNWGDYKRLFSEITLFDDFFENVIFSEKKRERIFVEERDFDPVNDSQTMNDTPKYFCKSGFRAVYKQKTGAINFDNFQDILDAYDLNDSRSMGKVFKDFLEKKIVSGRSVIFFTPPWYPNTKKYLHEKIPQTINFKDEFINLIRPYENAYYINFFDTDFFEESDFWEPTILNEKGSRKLSRVLNRALKIIEKGNDRFISSEMLNKLYLEVKENE